MKVWRGKKANNSKKPFIETKTIRRRLNTANLLKNISPLGSLSGIIAGVTLLIHYKTPHDAAMASLFSFTGLALSKATYKGGKAIERTPFVYALERPTTCKKLWKKIHDPHMSFVLRLIAEGKLNQSEIGAVKAITLEEATTTEKNMALRALTRELKYIEQRELDEITAFGYRQLEKSYRSAQRYDRPTL